MIAVWVWVWVGVGVCAAWCVIFVSRKRHVLCVASSHLFLVYTAVHIHCCSYTLQCTCASTPPSPPPLSTPSPPLFTLQAARIPRVLDVLQYGTDFAAAEDRERVIYAPKFQPLRPRVRSGASAW